MKMNATQSSRSASLFINDWIILRESVQQIRVADDHTPAAILSHIGEPTGFIDPEGGQWRDQLRFQQGAVQQQDSIVFCQHWKNTCAS